MPKPAKLQKKRPSRKSNECLRSFSSPIPKDSEICKYMFDQIADELILINEKGEIIYVNDAAVKGLGFTRKALLNKPIYKLFKQKMSLKRWKATHWAEHKKSKKPRHYVIERVTKKKDVQTIDVSAVYVEHDGKGYILSIARDITRQMVNQTKVRESEQLYKIITEGARDGIITVDLNGRIVYGNKALEKLVGISLNVSKGTSFKKYISETSKKKAIKCFQKAKKGHAQIIENIDIVDKKGGVIPVEVHVSPLYQKGKIVSLHAIVRDIRSRKKIEEMQKESEKMNALQYFISGTTQELKAPLGAVASSIEDLLSRYQDRDFEYVGFKEYQDIMRTLGNIRDQLKYCNATTNRLLELNKKRIRLRKKRCNGNVVIRDVLKIKKDLLAESGIRSQLRLEKKLPDVAIGKIELFQILDNLVNNAIQSMTTKERLLIRTCHNEEKKQVLIEVKDEGVGIPKDHLHHVFEPFFTTKQRGIQRNSGLGLSIVYALVKSCQGEIKIKSSLRTGTTVRLFLPQA